MPQVIVQKGSPLPSAGGELHERALYPLRLLPFTLHGVHERIDGSINEVRAFRRSVVDFTYVIHPFFKFPGVEGTAMHTWPVLFPGFDGVTDGSVTILFDPELSAEKHAS